MPVFFPDKKIKLNLSPAIKKAVEKAHIRINESQ